MSIFFSIEHVCSWARKLGVCILSAITATVGITWPVSSGFHFDKYTGEIVLTAANSCQKGTVLADGRLLQISRAPDHTTLFSLLGNSYGGDGRTTFAVHDLRDPHTRRFKRGEMLWCVVVVGYFPRRGGGKRDDVRIPGELMPFGPNFCPSGWQVESDHTLPHQKTINWCKAMGNAGQVKSIYAQMLLFSGNACPQDTMPADGKLLKIEQNQTLYSLLGAHYGGDGRTKFALPNQAAPSLGLKWCVVTTGRYPPRN